MRAPDDLNRTRIFVPALDCPEEEKEIRAALSRLPAVESLTFHLFSRQVEVRHRGEVEPVLDALRPEAPAAVRALRELGVAHIVLLTGDNAEAAGKAGAAAGYASLWMAVLADMGTTLLVIFNGLRLLRVRTSWPPTAVGGVSLARDV